MFDKITKGTVDATISTKDYTVKKWKRFIRKRAIKRVEKNLKYLQKDASDYTKEEMRELIEKEEKDVISTITNSWNWCCFYYVKFIQCLSG